MAKTAMLYVQLDVRFPDDDKIIEAGVDGAGLYAMALCRAKSLLTDGRLTRAQLRRLGGDDALIDRLIDVGLFTRDAGDAVRISAWMRRNPPASEVLDPHRGRWLAHRRHHEKRGVHNPDCPYCTGQQPPPDATSPQDDAQKCDANADPQCDANAEPAMPETETETETETHPLPSQTQFTTRHPPDDEADASPPTADEIIDALTDRRLDELADSGRIRTSRQAIRPSVRASIATDHHQAIHAALRTHPDRTAAEHADALTRRSVPAHESRHPALVAQAARDAAAPEAGEPAPPDVVAAARARALDNLNRPPNLRAVPNPPENP